MRNAIITLALLLPACEPEGGLVWTSDGQRTNNYQQAIGMAAYLDCGGTTLQSPKHDSPDVIRCMKEHGFEPRTALSR